MPPPDLQRIRLGLALVHWGFRLIAGAVISLAVVFAITGLLEPFKPGICFYCCLLMVVFVIPIPIAIGILVGVIGRPFCLRTPPELPIARARIRLSVLLEGSGLMMAVVNVAIAYIVAYCTNALSKTVVLQAVFAFAILLLIAGRIFFLAYTVALAKAVDMELTLFPSVTACLVIVSCSTIFATADWLSSTRGSPPFTLDQVLWAGGVGGAVLCVFGILYVYGRYLRRLREAVKQFNTPPAKEVALVLVQRPR
jgi:hypothetical protein